MAKNSIEIKNINNKKAYLEESYFIVRHYNQLISNSTKRIVPYIRERIYITIAIIVYVVSCIFIFNNGPVFNWFIIGLLFLAIVLCLRDIISASKYISKRSKEKSDAVLTINEDKVIFKNNKMHVTYECQWEDIKYILISKNCISFMPRTIDVGFLISIPIDYKEECIKLLEKYNKQDLIKYNRKSE